MMSLVYSYIYIIIVGPMQIRAHYPITMAPEVTQNPATSTKSCSRNPESCLIRAQRDSLQRREPSLRARVSPRTGSGARLCEPCASNLAGQTPVNTNSAAEGCQNQKLRSFHRRSSKSRSTYRRNPIQRPQNHNHNPIWSPKGLQSRPMTPPGPPNILTKSIFSFPKSRQK